MPRYLPLSPTQSTLALSARPSRGCARVPDASRLYEHAVGAPTPTIFKVVELEMLVAACAAGPAAPLRHLNPISIDTTNLLKARSTYQK